MARSLSLASSDIRQNALPRNVVNRRVRHRRRQATSPTAPRRQIRATLPVPVLDIGVQTSPRHTSPITQQLVFGCMNVRSAAGKIDNIVAVTSRSTSCVSARRGTTKTRSAYEACARGRPAGARTRPSPISHSSGSVYSESRTSLVASGLLCSTTQQWRSRTFGRSGRWSNLPPFRLRFWKLESLFKV